MARYREYNQKQLFFGLSAAGCGIEKQWTGK